MKKCLFTLMIFCVLFELSGYKSATVKAQAMTETDMVYEVQEIPGSLSRYGQESDLKEEEVRLEKMKALPSTFENQFVNEEKNRLYTITIDGIEYLDLNTEESVLIYEFQGVYKMEEPYISDTHVYIIAIDSSNEEILYVFDRDTDQLEKTYQTEYDMCAVGVDDKENILLSLMDADYNYTVQRLNTDGTLTHLTDMTCRIEEFVAAPGNGNIYYNVYHNWDYWGYEHTMCGLTYAAYDGDTFEESHVIVKDFYQVGWSYFYQPITFLNDTLAMDYLGNIYRISENAPKGESGMTFLFAVKRNNHEYDYPLGLGCQAAYFEDTNEIIGKNVDNRLYAYNIETLELTRSYEVAEKILSVYPMNGKLVVVQNIAGNPPQKLVDVVDRNQFKTMTKQTLSLNKQEGYKNRTKADIIKQYHNAIGKSNLTQKVLSAQGSHKKPYRETAVSAEAQKILLDFSNYQRWLAGLTPYVTGTDETIKNTGKGAVLLSVADTVGHDPDQPADMDDKFYEEAYTTVGGNISYSRISNVGGAISAIRGLTDDVGNITNTGFSINDGLVTYHQGYNTPGHRNTFLQRGGTKLTYGIADGVLLQYYEYAQRNPNETGTIEEMDNNAMAYAWPAPGYFPKEEIDRKAVWTVYLNTDQLDLGDMEPRITITDLKNNTTYVRDMEMSQYYPYMQGYCWSNFWGKSISFSPPEADDYAGKSYKVTIENLEASDGRPTTLEYTVKFFEYAGRYKIDDVEYDCDINGKWYQNHKYEKVTSKATTKKNGSIKEICKICGKTNSTPIYRIKSASLSEVSYIYNGKTRKPSVEVKDSKNNIISSDNYSISYKKNKNVGQATVTIKLKKKYSGTLTKTFTIEPKSTNIKSLSAMKKGFTVKWNKQTTQTSGYQICYSKNSDFAKSKSKTVSTKSTLQEITGLESKTKYYVKIRTYKTVGGKKFYSAWSKVKTVKTK